MRERGVEYLPGSRSPSRRRLIQLGALSAGGLIIGATAAAASTPGVAGPGQDGAAPGDPHVRSQMMPMTTGVAAPTSYNGIRKILADCGNVIYWGGDFSGTPDEMHFEINVPPGDLQLPALVAKIRGIAPPPPVRVISLQARVNSRYVTAEQAGAQPLIANRDAIGLWEKFDVIAVGTSHVALRAHANNRFVCADRAGGASLVANRDAVGLWETFTTVPQPDGTTALRAAVNGRYVTAEQAGIQPLIANRTAVGPWEKFTITGT